jgi:hypothetical protein
MGSIFNPALFDAANPEQFYLPRRSETPDADTVLLVEGQQLQCHSQIVGFKSDLLAMLFRDLAPLAAGSSAAAEVSWSNRKLVAWCQPLLSITGWRCMPARAEAPACMCGVLLHSCAAMQGSARKRRRLEVPLPAGAGGQEYTVKEVSFCLRFVYHEAEANSSSFDLLEPMLLRSLLLLAHHVQADTLQAALEQHMTAAASSGTLRMASLGLWLQAADTLQLPELVRDLIRAVAGQATGSSF